jgi:hypothetical protein
MILARLDVNRLTTPRNGVRQFPRLDAFEEVRLRPLRRILINRDFGRSGRAQYVQHDSSNGNPSKCGHVRLPQHENIDNIAP